MKLSKTQFPVYCEYDRPFEIEYDDDNPEEDYKERRKKMLK